MGREKKPERRRKKRKKARTARLCTGLKHHVGAIDLGAENDAKLGANNHGAKLGAKIDGAELAAMSASTPSTWPQPRRQTL